MNILARFHLHSSRIAVTDRYGTFTYGQLNHLANEIAGNVKAHLTTADKSKRKSFSPQPSVAYFCPRDHTYVAAQWASWRAGAIGVPLGENYPVDDLRYLLEDSGAAVVLSHTRCVDALRPAAEKAGVPIVLINEIRDVLNPSSVPELSPPPPPLDIGENALLIYTSGTTGRPKGVLVRHEVPSMLPPTVRLGAMPDTDGLLALWQARAAQIRALVEAWEWSPDDRILSVLPLHHVHGIVAVQANGARK